MSAKSSASYLRMLERLFRARRHGVELRLDRMHAVLSRLGNPERSIGTIVLVGGTNGKGSTCAFLDAIARASGVRSAVFSSPHLNRFTERFVIDGEHTGDQQLVAAAEEVADADGDSVLTFFEQTTAIALVLFARVPVELAILEVGLGGRLDATNAVEPSVAVVTGVALDHQSYLGSSLADIAREKAGIFRPGTPAFIGVAGRSGGTELLAAAAREQRARPIEIVGTAHVAAVPQLLGIPGHYQRGNAALATLVAGQLGYDAVEQGLAAARIGGRFEIVGAGESDVVLDGAHNPHAAEALAAELARREWSYVLVVAISSDKDIAGIVSPLAGQARAVIATLTRSERSASSAAIADAARLSCNDVRSVNSLAAALTAARSMSQDGDRIVVAGSMFAVGEARELLLGVPSDPARLSDPVHIA